MNSELRRTRLVSLSIVTIFILSAFTVVAFTTEAASSWLGGLPDKDGADDYEPDNPYLETRNVDLNGNAEIMLGAMMTQTHYEDYNPDCYVSVIKPLISVNTLGTVDYNVQPNFAGYISLPSIQSWNPNVVGNGVVKIEFPDIIPYNDHFTFSYFGLSYHSFYLYENGFITFGEASSYNLGTSRQTTFPDQSFSPHGIIAPLWTDLGTTATSITCGYSSSDWSWMDIFSIRWNNVDSGGGKQTFMISLREDGAIVFDYSTYRSVSAASGYESIDAKRGRTVTPVSGTQVIIYPTPGSYQWIDYVEMDCYKSTSGSNGEKVSFLDPTNGKWNFPGYNIWTLTAYTPPGADDVDLYSVAGSVLRMCTFVPYVGPLLGVTGYLMGYADICSKFQDQWEPQLSSQTPSELNDPTTTPGKIILYSNDMAASPENPTAADREWSHSLYCMPTVIWSTYDLSRTNPHSLVINLKVTVYDSSGYNPLNPNGPQTGHRDILTGSSITFGFVAGDPHITLTDPNGGEVIEPRSVFPITWTSDPGIGSLVNIELLKGTTRYSVATNVPNTGSYSWTVPSNLPAGSDFRICVSSKWMTEHDHVNNYFGPIYDNSDGTFTLTLPPGPRLTVRAIDMNLGGIADSCGIELGHLPWVGPDIGQNLDDDIVQFDGPTWVMGRAYHSNYWDFHHWEYKGVTYATEPWPHDKTFYVDGNAVLIAYYHRIEWVSLWQGAPASDFGTTDPAPFDYGGYDYGSTVTFTAYPAANVKFDHWRYSTASGTQEFHDTTAPYTLTFTVTDDVTVQPWYIPKVDLYMAVSPSGSGTTSPATGTYIDYKYQYETVTASAYPTTGYLFDHWIYSSLGVDYTYANNPVTVTLTCPWDNYLTAHFRATFNPPGTPVNLVATSGQKSICLSWTAPNDGGSPITGYEVNRRLGTGALYNIASIGSQPVAYQDWNITLGSTYSYEVVAKNAGFMSVIPAVASCTSVDSIAPTSTATPAGTLGSNGYFKSGVTVTLTAADGHGTGVKTIKYKLDGGTLKTYSAPFAVTGDKTHTVDYYATDNNNNVELTKTKTVKIDATAPTTSCTLTGTKDRKTGQYTTQVTVRLTATDGTTGSGIAQTWYKLDGLPWALYTGQFMVGTSGGHTVYYYSVDNAGNTAVQKQTGFIIWSGPIPV